MKPAFAMTALALSFLSFAHAAPTKPPVIEAALNQGFAEFTAVGRPSALKIHGKTEKLQGGFTLQGSKVIGTARLPLETLDTGISTRDRHMKEKYLELGKYPEATLQISKLALPTRLPQGDFKMEGILFEGPLTLHGKTKTVQGTASIARAAGQMLVDAQFGIRISDFGIAVPVFAGITVADEVNIHVQSRPSLP